MTINKNDIGMLFSGLGMGLLFGGLTATLIQANAVKDFSSTQPILNAIVCGLTAYMLTKSCLSAMSSIINADHKPSYGLNWSTIEGPSLAAFCGGVLAATAVHSILR